MSDFSNVGTDDKKQMIDIIKAKIESYDRNYYSLRDLEWRTALQFLTGYIAIGIGYNQLRQKNGNNEILDWWCIAFTILLFIVFLVFRFLVQQRLKWARDRTVEFGIMLHEIQPLTKNAKETEYKLWLKNRYAIITQILVHLLTSATVVFFIIFSMNGAIR